MRVPLYDTLRRLDRRWLLNYPLLWIMRLHWMVSFWLLGLVLICLFALVLPVSLETVEFLNSYFWAVLALAGLAVSPWIYLQARFAPQLRQNPQARTAVYLLAGYLVIFCIYLAWPYAFVGILEAKIASRISESELRKDSRNLAIAEHTFASLMNTLVRDKNNIFSPAPVSPNFKEHIREIQHFLLKYVPSDRYAKDAEVTLVRDALGILINVNRVRMTMRDISYIKGVDSSFLFNGVNSSLNIEQNILITFFLEDSRCYNDWIAFVSLGTTVLLLALLLRVLQTTAVKSLLITLFLGIAVWIALIFYSSSGLPMKEAVSSSILLLLFSAGWYATFRAPRLGQKRVLSAAGMNVFILLLAWGPFLLRVFGKRAGYRFVWENSAYGGRLETAFFLLGVVLLFALTPWIQRRYIALEAKPS